eukprot:13024912-Heterocapsa_arctica.AAC.1
MAMGFICIRFDYVKEGHAYCMKQNQPDKRAKDKDGIVAERYSHQESKTDKGARSNRRTDWLAVSNNDKHYSRVGSVGVKHLFNETTYVAQPLIV